EVVLVSCGVSGEHRYYQSRRRKKRIIATSATMKAPSETTARLRTSVGVVAIVMGGVHHAGRASRTEDRVEPEQHAERDEHDHRRETANQLLVGEIDSRGRHGEDR